MLLPNGNVVTSSGSRCVAFTKDGTAIKPVATAQRSGHLPVRCTFQDVSMGDLVYQINWVGLKNAEENAMASALRGTGLVKAESYTSVLVVSGSTERHDPDNNGKAFQVPILTPAPENAKQLIENVMKQHMLSDNALWQWLQPTTRKESYLPAGFGWDGTNTVADIRKAQRIRELFVDLLAANASENDNGNENFVDDIVYAAKKSPGKGLPTHWERYAKAGPTEIAHRKNQRWVFWGKDGSVILIADSYLSEKGKMQVPEDVIRACCVTFEAYKREQDRYGVKFDLYEYRTSELAKISEGKWKETSSKGRREQERGIHHKTKHNNHGNKPKHPQHGKRRKEQRENTVAM
jgi:hypothetical protein